LKRQTLQTTSRKLRETQEKGKHVLLNNMRFKHSVVPKENWKAGTARRITMQGNSAGKAQEPP